MQSLGRPGKAIVLCDGQKNAQLVEGGVSKIHDLLK
jgi:hypothetical protein